MSEAAAQLLGSHAQQGANRAAHMPRTVTALALLLLSTWPDTSAALGFSFAPVLPLQTSFGEFWSPSRWNSNRATQERIHAGGVGRACPCALHSIELAGAARAWAEVDSSGVLADSLAVACSYAWSDTLAQLTERRLAKAVGAEGRFDAARTQRLALFGIADGAFHHTWFVVLDGLIGDGQGAIQTLSKTAADTLVYTPFWCAWFLLAMAVLESRDVHDVPAHLRRVPSIWCSDWQELVRGTVGFFLPFTAVIFGFVPLHQRVFAFGCLNLIYTTILSMWNANSLQVALDHEIFAGGGGGDDAGVGNGARTVDARLSVVDEEDFTDARGADGVGDDAENEHSLSDSLAR
jgi:hypothetical protein